MAKEPSVPNENPEAQEQTSPPATTSTLFSKIKVLLFVALVIVVECAAAYWYLPSAEETALLAGAGEELKENSKTMPEEEAEKPEDVQVEADLGEFSVTAYQPVSNTTLRIDFRLYGTVAAVEVKDFEICLEENKHRFRDQIIVIVRSAEIADLTDAGLGLVKRKILDKTNRMLGKPFLKSVIFSDFSFIEQ